ncbi:alpha-1B adrenergic receptor-like [Paramacrobiotus metropolitanus]|uniref:alpha-1B adrenergic receptor-like n=1 Tax=Paramacrobiotus metropolitanus TaxID=2943436 RepID=UPI002445FEA8|nr:alpha-1B adrenergic receptor-like [Paramacrobiotus metropolitanus]
MNFSSNNKSSSFSNTSKSLPNLPASTLIPWAAVYFTQCFAGAACNLLLIFLIFTSGKLRAGCSLLIGHCLIPQFILCSVGLPLNGVLLYGHQVHRWQLNTHVSCNVTLWIAMTCRYANNCIEAYIGANRVVALFKPHQYRAFARTRVEHGTVTILWIISMFLAGLGCFDLGIRYFVLPLGSCGLDQKDMVGAVTFALGYYVPLVFAAVGYCLIYIKMAVNRRNRTKTFPVVHVSQFRDSDTAGTVLHNGRNTAEKRRVSKLKMVFVAFFWNVLCYLIWPVVVMFAPHLLQIPLASLVFGNITPLGYTITPILFLGMSGDYQKEWRRLFHAAQYKLLFKKL